HRPVTAALRPPNWPADQEPSSFCVFLRKLRALLTASSRALSFFGASAARAAGAASNSAIREAVRRRSRSSRRRSRCNSPSSAASGGMPDLSTLNPELKKYAGKRWGDIPGELRTKIIQDMQAKYGEDYARNIKLYFEQLAETKKK